MKAQLISAIENLGFITSNIVLTYDKTFARPFRYENDSLAIEISICRKECYLYVKGQNDNLPVTIINC